MGDTAHSEEIVSRLKRFFSGRPDVAAAYLFGSATGNRFGPLSDVDVAVLVREGPEQGKTDAQGTPLDPAGRAGPSPIFNEIQVDLAGRLPALTGGRRVDVIILNRAPVHLAFPAVHEGVLLHGQDEPQRVLFEVDLLRRHTDYRPVISEYHAALRERIERREFLGS